MAKPKVKKQQPPTEREMDWYEWKDPVARLDIMARRVRNASFPVRVRRRGIGPLSPNWLGAVPETDGGLKDNNAQEAGPSA